MPWTRRLPSGLWAATVYTPAGRRTESDPLKGRVEEWAANLESDIRRGEFIDPRLSRKTVDEIWEQYGSARQLEQASRKRDTSIYRNHVKPRWGHIPVGAVLKPDVQAWVNGLDDLKRRGEIGGWTIIAALNVLKAVLELAVDAKCLRANAARRVHPPVAPEHVDRVFEPEEEALFLGRLDELFPGRRDARLFVEALLETGGRWEEVAAAKREAVDLRKGLLWLGPVVERDGTVREYPKGARSRQSAGFRWVPLGREYLGRLRPVVLATSAGGLVFTTATGRVLRYANWLPRVWNPALRARYAGPAPVRPAGRRGPLPVPLGPPLLADPQPTPHDCRHTYGTRLADAGVEQHDRMALMGHKDERSGRRYVHSGEGRYDRARDALERARAAR